MEKRTKYFILFIVLIANLVYQCLFNFGLWNILASSIFIAFLFDQFACVDQNRLFKFLTYLMMVVCLVNAYRAIKTNDWIMVYVYLGFFLFLLWVYLHPTLIALSRFLLKKSHFSIALKVINCDIFIFGKKPYVMALKGAIMNGLERFDEALACLEESKEFGYDHPFLYSNLGYCLNYLEDYERACECLKTAADRDPNDFSYQYGAATLLVNLGKYEEALYYVDRASDLDGDDGLLEKIIDVIEENLS